MDDMTMNQAAPAQDSKPDISKATLAVLVLLTLVISIVGTWTVMSEVGNMKVTQEPKSASGKVSLNIVDPNAPKAEPVASTGKVVLNLQ